MYNGIGLRTAKGSATSGFVQRNIAHVRPEFFRSQLSKNRAGGDRRAHNADKSWNGEKKKGKVSDDILQHNRKRAIEGKVFDLAEELRVQGKYSEEEIEEKCKKLRETLTCEMERNSEKRDGGNKGDRDRRYGSIHIEMDRDSDRSSRSRSRSRDRDERYLVSDRHGRGRRRGVCFAYQKGQCSRGDDCRFVHEYEYNDKNTAYNDEQWVRSNEVTDTHEREHEKAKQNERFRQALGLRGTFREGDSFNHEVQSKRRAEEKMEREKRRQEAAERRERRTREVEEAQARKEVQEINSSARVVGSSGEPRLLSDLVRLGSDREEEGEELDSNEEGQERNLHEDSNDKSGTFEVNTDNSSENDESLSRRRHDSDSD